MGPGISQGVYPLEAVSFKHYFHKGDLRPLGSPFLVISLGPPKCWETSLTAQGHP